VTPSEFVQLKAFARIDGALLSLLWISSFIFYVMGLTSPGFGLVALILAVATPFFAGIRLKHFRDFGLEGSISLMRGWGYIVFVFFYGGLLFALAQWAYFTYIDQGYLLSAVGQMMTTPETMEALRALGMGDELQKSLDALGEMRPIDLSLNMLTTNIMIGMVLGLPIAALLQKGSQSKIENP
jgi:hypothetical protein